MEQTVWITIGVAGDGKSTWARMKADSNSNVSIVSKDSIREMLHGKYVFDEVLEPLVEEINYRAIVEVLSTGRSLVIDECHIKKSDRTKVVNFIHSRFPLIKIVGVWCMNKENLSRRIKNPKTTGSEDLARATWCLVINGMNLQFEEPTKEEFDDMVYFRS